MSTLDELLASGGQSMKFDTPGDTYTGVVDSVAVRQATEFGTGKPLTFDNGDPREQIVITVKTDLQDNPDDDGYRSCYVKGWGPQKRAFVAAVKAAGGSPAPGDRFTATFIGLGEKSPQGGFPPKLYEYTIVKDAEAPAVEGGSPPWEKPAEDDATVKARELLATGLLTVSQVAAATGLPAGIVKTLTLTQS